MKKIRSIYIMILCLLLLLGCNNNLEKVEEVKLEIPTGKLDNKNNVELKISEKTIEDISLDLLENTPKQLEVDFEESIQEVLIETKETYQPVVETVVEYIPEPEPVVYKEEADFSPEEYTIISYDVAPIIYDYEPLQEWFIPDGNVDEFSMDSLKGLNNAYGTNYKHISLRFYNEYRGSEYSTLEGVTKFLKSYTDNVFYLVGDNEEGNLGWEFHIEISKNESINLINTLKTNEKIKAISIVGSIMPMFKDIEEEIDLEEFKYSQL